MVPITPFLSFQQDAEQAVEFYVSTFPDSRVLKTSRYGENMPLPAGTILTMEFELNGQKFIALNGGPEDRFNMAISFVVHCNDQAEVDHYWNAFAGGGGQEIACGWVRDRFGICWQVVPEIFMKLLNDPDKAKVNRVMQAMMKMKKMIIADLEAAAQA